MPRTFKIYNSKNNNRNKSNKIRKNAHKKRKIIKSKSRIKKREVQPQPQNYVDDYVIYQEGQNELSGGTNDNDIKQQLYETPYNFFYEFDESSHTTTTPTPTQPTTQPTTQATPPETISDKFKNNLQNIKKTIKNETKKIKDKIYNILTRKNRKEQHNDPIIYNDDEGGIEMSPINQNNANNPIQYNSE